MEIITNFAEIIQANPMLLVGLSIWEAFFTLLALWFSARNNHKGWFIACGLLQIFGIVEIIYLVNKTNFFKDFKFDA